MGAVQSNLCAAWATPEDTCVPCSEDDFAAGVLDDALLAASNLLFILSGRQYPGLCEIEVSPTPGCANDGGGRPVYTQGVQGPWWQSWGCCGSWAGGQSSCECGCAVGLGVGPIAAVGSVTIDGAVLAPALYRVDDWSVLRRLPDADGSNPGWPSNDLCAPVGGVGTWQVEVTYGVEPPAEGVMAAGVLGCELAKACAALDSCQLPKRVQTITRQGVSMTLIDPLAFLSDGLTGLGGIVDMFIKAHNPAGRRGRARVLAF